MTLVEFREQRAREAVPLPIAETRMVTGPMVTPLEWEMLDYWYEQAAIADPRRIVAVENDAWILLNRLARAVDRHALPVREELRAGDVTSTIADIRAAAEP